MRPPSFAAGGARAVACPVLETERLILRRVAPADAEALLSIYGDAAVMRYYRRTPCRTVEACRRVVDAMLEGERTGAGFRWSLVARDAGQVAGSIGFHAWDRTRRTARLSYELVPARRGWGLATEAARAVVRFGFETMALDAVEAEIHADNAPSLGVVRRLGFRGHGWTKHTDPDGQVVAFSLYRLPRTAFPEPGSPE